jgi:hypothetical protein
MICLAKPVLTEDWCIVHKEEFAKCILDERPSIFIADKPIFSSENMLHKDCYREGSVDESLWS